VAAVVVAAVAEVEAAEVPVCRAEWVVAVVAEVVAEAASVSMA
jgi:hypothetical protein